MVEILRGRLEGLGPATVEALANSFGLTKNEIEGGLLKLEAEGFVIRGHFTPGTTRGPSGHPSGVAADVAPSARTHSQLHAQSFAAGDRTRSHVGFPPLPAGLAKTRP